MKNGLVSIVTPLYNAEAFIVDTFNSVVNQSFKNWEWIIVDDCSTDSSLSLITTLAKNYNNIKVLKQNNNSGSAAARNLGLKAACGQYITFLDADDMLDSNYLQSQIDFIKNNGPIITAGYRRVSKNSSSIFMPRKSINFKEALKGNDTSCLTTMFDKSVIGEVYFPEALSKSEDYVFWLDILKKGYVVKTNSVCLATYRIISTSKSRNKFKLIKPMFIIYRKYVGLNWFSSWFCVFRWAIYGMKKYKEVK